MHLSDLVPSAQRMAQIALVAIVSALVAWPFLVAPRLEAWRAYRRGKRLRDGGATELPFCRSRWLP